MMFMATGEKAVPKVERQLPPKDIRLFKKLCEITEAMGKETSTHDPKDKDFELVFFEKGQRFKLWIFTDERNPEHPVFGIHVDKFDQEKHDRLVRVIGADANADSPAYWTPVSTRFPRYGGESQLKETNPEIAEYHAIRMFVQLAIPP